MSPSFTVTASSFCIFHCTSLIISQRNGGLPECNLSDRCPADSSFLQPAAISSPTAGGGQAPAPTGMLSSPKGAQRENWVDKEFIFSFFQDSSGPACVPKLACWWTYLCKKARAAAWCTSLATVGNHILVIFRWPLEDRVHEPRAENLCGLSWNQRDLSKSYAEKSQELESWSQSWWLIAGLYSFGSAGPRCSGARMMPGSPSQPCCHRLCHQRGSLAGLWPQTPLTDWWQLKPAAIWLWESQIIKLPVIGFI